MLCKDLQTKIAVHDALTPEERLHAEACRDCAAFAAFDAGLDARLPHWRASVARAPRRPAPARRFRLAYAGIGLATALSLAMLALPARSSAQEAYRRMLGRVRNVGSVHLVVRWRPGEGRPSDGPMRKTYELWWRPGAWREAGEGLRPSLKLAKAGGTVFYRFDPGAGKVRAAHELAAQTDYRAFDLATFAERYMATPTRFEQPAPTTLVATNAGGWSRMVFTLDPSTGLPTHAVKEWSDGQAWTAAGELDLEFDRAVDERRFDPADLAEGPTP